MSKAGHIARPRFHFGFPTGSPDPSLYWVEHSRLWGTSGQGFGSVRLFIHPYKFDVWRSFARWARGPATGGGVRLRIPVSVRRYSHFFQNFADVAHQLVSSVGFHVGNIDRESFRHAQKDFAFGAKNE